MWMHVDMCLLLLYGECYVKPDVMWSQVCMCLLVCSENVMWSQTCLLLCTENVMWSCVPDSCVQIECYVAVRFRYGKRTREQRRSVWTISQGSLRCRSRLTRRRQITYTAALLYLTNILLQQRLPWQLHQQQQLHQLGIGLLLLLHRLTGLKYVTSISVSYSIKHLVSVIIA